MARPGPHWNPWPEDKSTIQEELKGLREYIDVTKRIGDAENMPHVRTMEVVLKQAEKGDWKQARKAWLKLPSHLQAGMSGRLFNHYISNAAVKTEKGAHAMKRTPLQQAEMDYREASEEYKMWARTGDLTNEERGYKRLAEKKMNEAWKRIQKLKGAKAMTTAQEKQIIKTLVSAGHESLAKTFARSRGYRVKGAYNYKQGPFHEGDRHSGGGKWIVVVNKSDPKDSYASRDEEQALMAALFDEGTKYDVYEVEAKDAGAARLLYKKGKKLRTGTAPDSDVL